jgi:hypothetical protein
MQDMTGTCTVLVQAVDSWVETIAAVDHGFWVQFRLKQATRSAELVLLAAGMCPVVSFACWLGG